MIFGLRMTTSQMHFHKVVICETKFNRNAESHANVWTIFFSPYDNTIQERTALGLIFVSVKCF
jgi:hypothetical protein